MPSALTCGELRGILIVYSLLIPRWKTRDPHGRYYTWKKERERYRERQREWEGERVSEGVRNGEIQ